MIEILENVDPLDGEVTLDSKATPALQFSDDLALVANSAKDLNRLLARSGAYCDRTHQVTQTTKTVVVVFTFEDGSLRLEVGRIRDGRHCAMVFKYEDSELAVSELFDYLGVRTHWRDGPEAAWQQRDKRNESFGCD